MAFFGVLPEVPSTGQQIARGLGGALGSSVAPLSKRFIEGMRQSKAAKGLIDQVVPANFPEDRRKLLMQSLSSLPADKQADALQKLMEARAISSYFSEEPEQEYGFSSSGHTENSAEEGVDKFIDLKEEGEKTSPRQTNTESKSIKIGGVDFQNSELPKKTKRIPAIGKLAKSAEIQDKSLRENRKELNEIAKPYKDIIGMKKNLVLAKDAEKLINEGNINPTFMTKAALAISGASIKGLPIPDLKKFATNADEQKLSALMATFARPKEIGGSNPSTKEVLIAMERNPDILNHPEANKYLIQNLLHGIQTDLKRAELIQGLRKYDPYMDPSTLESIVDEKVGQYQASELPRMSPVTPKEKIERSVPAWDYYGRQKR